MMVSQPSRGPNAPGSAH